MLWVSVLALALVACGEVITPEPVTRTAVPSPTPTAVPSLATATPPLRPTPATATPTITPTPIVHVIQAGDTLGSIAATYGVSVQALRDANGIENPLLLQIGQELVIPTGNEGPAPPAGLLPTPTPLPFGVQGVGFYETPAGSLWCLGEVVNTTPYTLTNVEVRVTLFDAAGTPLVAGDSAAAADILLPAAQAPLNRAPFAVLFLSPPPDFASHNVALLRGEFAGSLAEGIIPLTVEEVSSAPSGPEFEITGAVRNPDPEQMAASVVVIVTTYDGDGRVTGFRQQTVDVGDGLLSGDAVSFRMLLTAHGTAPADLSVIAFGRVPAEE